MSIPDVMCQTCRIRKAVVKARSVNGKRTIWKCKLCNDRASIGFIRIGKEVDADFEKRKRL